MISLPLSQTDLLTISMVKLAYLKADWADFSAFNAVRFNLSFIQGYEQAIEQARDIPTDETVMDTGTELTATLQERLHRARRLYKYVKYFVEEAYADNEGRRSKFGLDDYKNVRASASKMLVFMSNLHNQCVAYQQELIGTGMDASKIAELEQARDQLQEAIIERKEFEGQRMETTQQRSDAFLKLYELLRQVCRAGKVIYEDENEAKYRRYLMPRPEQAARELELIIESNTQKAVDDQRVTADTMYEIVNTGEVALLFYATAAIADPAPPNAVELRPGDNRVVKAGEISSGAYTLLVARNDSASQGRCKVFELEQPEE